MLFHYRATDISGSVQTGTVDAINVDLAFSLLKRRGLTVVSIKSSAANPFDRRKGYSFGALLLFLLILIVTLFVVYYHFHNPVL